VNSFPLHPDCPDLASRGPNLAEAALRVQAEQVAEDLKEQKEGWRKGFTRRRVLGTAGTVTVAALGTQYVDTKVSFGKTKNGVTLIDLFLYGGADGLHLLVPNNAQLGSEILRDKRGGLALGNQELMPLENGWAANRQALEPLMPLWEAKELALVPAVGRRDASRSHFDEEDYYQCGGPPAQVRTGLYNRMLTALGPGSTFRGMSRGNTISRSLVGPAPTLSLDNIGDFKFPGYDKVAPASKAAINSLYRGLDLGLTTQVANTMKSLAFAENLTKTRYVPANGVQYEGGFENSLRDLAQLIKGGAEVEVATIGAGGFDTHSGQKNQLERIVREFATGIAKFRTDLGPEMWKKVVISVRSEFGRRVDGNGSGTDHGNGGLMMVMGGAGVNGGVHGRWAGLADGVLDNGDVPGLNSQFDVIGELAQKILGVGSVASIFPGHPYKPIGIARTVA